MVEVLKRVFFDKTLLRYIFVGLISTLTHYLVFLGVYKGLSQSVAVGTVAGFLASWIIAYTINYFYTFESKKSHHGTVLKYTLVTIFGLSINVTIMTTFIEILGINYNVSFLVMSIVVFASNYIFSRKFVF